MVKLICAIYSSIHKGYRGSLGINFRECRLKHRKDLVRMRGAAAQAVPGRAAELAVEGMLQLLERRDSVKKIG